MWLEGGAALENKMPNKMERAIDCTCVNKYINPH